MRIKSRAYDWTAFYWRHQEKIKQRVATFRRANLVVVQEKEKARAAKNRLEHPEREKQKTKKWRKANLDVLAAKERRRRARKKNVGGSHSAADVAAILKAQKKKCAVCRASLKGRNYHVDHIVPLAREGTNDRRNLQILCPRCNTRKSSRDPVEFMQAQGKLL